MELQTQAMELLARTRDADTETFRKDLQEVKSKNESKSFMQKWKNNLTLETHDSIARGKEMLEKKVQCQE